jgi:Carboxypeptidase regulatory-like domain
MRQFIFAATLLSSAVIAIGCSRYEYRPYYGEPDPSPRAVLQRARIPEPIISGRVVDARNTAALERAEVRVEPGARRVETDVEGWFVLRELNPGVYTVSARRLGFHQLLVDSVRISSTEGAELQLPLAPEVLRPAMVQRVRKPWWRWW